MRSKFMMRAAFVWVAMGFVLAACTPKNAESQHSKTYPVETEISFPEWTSNAVIYEVNIRQYSPEGTFNAFAEHLPRLKQLGVDILWLMPVFPIGKEYMKVSQTMLAEELADPEERKQYLGSYYSIRDYMTVNPEFGTEADFRALVEKAHKQDMYVILDIAVNHTAWDHPWIKDHPGYYTRVDTANPPWNKEWMSQHPEYFTHLKKLGMTYPVDKDETDWWDTADLNYDNDSLREEMLSIFKFWVSEFDIDGYRADVAGRVPCDFWDDVKQAVDSVKEVFMLAENEDKPCLLKEAFHMNYAWELHHIMNDVAKGKKPAIALNEYFAKQDTLYDPAIYRMNFITNHDENSWNGTVSERLGDAAEAYAALMFMVPGMPLIYSGQEIGLDKRLRFFERDPITWTDSQWENVYQQLTRIKKSNPALWNGSYGGTLNILRFEDENVFGILREKDGNQVLFIANFGKNTVSVSSPVISEKWTDAIPGRETGEVENISLETADYLIWVRDTHL